MNSIAALAAVLTCSSTALCAQTHISGPVHDIDFERVARADVQALGVIGTPNRSAITGAPIVIQSWAGERDPFNPLHHVEPISRTHIDVFVTDAMTTCPRIWAALDCPVVVRADGTRDGMVIQNYSHSGPRHITVERIEYPQSVKITDAGPLYFVAVEE